MRVLLIEDDSATAQSIELMLKSESFNVYTTDLGEEGVDLGKLYDYDIILLDLNLPKRNGTQVLERVRRSASCGSVPVVILTSSDSPRDRSQVAELRATQYFRKPSRLDDFMKLGPLVKDLLAGQMKTHA